MYCRVRFDMMVPPSQPLRQYVPAVLCSPGRMENSSLYLLCLISAWYWQKVQKAVRKIVQKWSRFRPQPEPDAPDRFNMVFASRVPQLAAQIADVGLERAFRAVGVALLKAFCILGEGYAHDKSVLQASTCQLIKQLAKLVKRS